MSGRAFLRPVRLARLMVLSLAGFAVLPWLTGADESPALVQTPLRGHAEPVLSIALSPDGKFAVTGSFDKSIKVWDAVSGKDVKTYGGVNGHKDIVLAVAVSPDGTQIASGSVDNSARVWDFPTSNSIKEIALKEGADAVAVSADGTKSATGSRDGAVKVWNNADGKELLNLTGHTGPVTSLAFSPNGLLLISAGADRTLRFWTLPAGQPVTVIGAHAGTPTGVVVNAAGNTAYSVAEDGGAEGLDPPRRRLPPRGRGPRRRCHRPGPVRRQCHHRHRQRRQERSPLHAGLGRPGQDCVGTNRRSHLRRAGAQ